MSLIPSVLGTLSLIPNSVDIVPNNIRDIVPNNIRDNVPNTNFFLAFTLKLELIEINFLQENESIPISIVLSNSYDNYRLNWNDLDAN